MADTLYGLNAEDVARLHRMLADYESGALHEGPNSQATRLATRRQQAFIAKTGSAIAALSGTTPGKGTVTIYRINDSDQLEIVSLSKTAYNVASAEVAADTWIQVKLISTRPERWVIDWENCGA